MAKKIYTTEQLEAEIMKGLRAAAATGRMKAYEVIQEVLYRWYGSYKPKQYDRTLQLFHSLVMDELKKTADGYESVVYFDVSKIKYTTGKQPSGSDVLASALVGKHGAKGLKEVSGLVPLGFASLFELNKSLINEMVSAMKAAGINVKQV